MNCGDLTSTGQTEPKNGGTRMSWSCNQSDRKRSKGLNRLISFHQTRAPRRCRKDGYRDGSWSECAESEHRSPPQRCQPAGMGPPLVSCKDSCAAMERPTLCTIGRLSLPLSRRAPDSEEAEVACRRPRRACDLGLSWAMHRFHALALPLLSRIAPCLRSSTRASELF